MAKRKRSRRKAQYKPVVSTQAARARSQAARAKTKATKAEAQVSFADEYHYVITDLRNMGLLAAAMFALLTILALIFA